jgi:uncharacterized protein YjdB
MMKRTAAIRPPAPTSAAGASAGPKRRLARLAALAGFFALLGACNSQGFDPNDLSNYKLSKVSGDSQSVLVGGVLPETLVVHLSTNGGERIMSGTVSWWVVVGDGRVSACGGGAAGSTLECRPGAVQIVREGATNATGFARAIWTLGPQAGTQTLIATVGDKRPEDTPPSRQAVFTATAISNAVHTVTVSPDTATLQTGESRPFTYTLRNVLGTVLSDRNLTIHSSNINVVELNGSMNEARGVGVGEADVVVQSEGKEGRLRIRVVPRPVASVVLSADSLRLFAGQTHQLTGTVNCTGGACGRTIPVTWTSTDSTIVRVSQTGLVTAAGAGRALVIASAEGRADSAVINVRPASRVARIELDPQNPTIDPGATQQFRVMFYDAQGNRTTVEPGGALRFTSSNTAAATIDLNLGRATAVATGATTVTATYLLTGDVVTTTTTTLTIR